MSSTLRTIGFPSPAANYLEEPLDLNRLLVPHPAATFFMEAEGTAMERDGIRSGDILVVDRSLAPAEGQVVVAHVEGELLMRRLERREGRVVLAAADPTLPLYDCERLGDALRMFGVVTAVIHRMEPRG